MTQYFFEDELLKVKEQRKKVLNLFFVILAIYVLASVGIVIYYTTLPYTKPDTITLVKVIHHVITAIMVIFSLIYLGIVYKRVNDYYKMTVNLKTGLKETSTATFLRYDDDIQNKDGVDCKALIFSEWNKYKKDYYERKVLVFYEKDYPELKENQTVRFITQSNLLVSYEIVENQNIEEKN